VTSSLLAIGIVLLSWALLAAALAGWGLLAGKALRLSPDAGEPRLVDAVFVGYAAVAAALLVWNFVAPIGAAVSGVLAGVGLLAAARYGQWRRRWRVGLAWARRHRVATVCLAVLVLWLAHRGTGPGDANDSGLYHYNAIRWAQAAAVPPGLGNLHLRLGFNGINTLVLAAIDHGPWAGLAHHLHNSLLLACLAAAGVVAATRVRRAAAVRASDAAGLLLLPVVAMLAVSKEAHSPTTDLPAAAFALLAAIRLLETGEHRRRGRAGPPARLTLVLVTAAALVKLSAGVFAAAVAAALVVMSARAGLPRVQWRRHATAAVVLLAVLVGPWLLRSVVLTGAPLWPSRAVMLPVPWAVQKDVGPHIREFARVGLAGFIASRIGRHAPGVGAMIAPPEDAATSTFGWLPSWCATSAIGAPMRTAVPLLIGLMGLAAAAAGARRRHRAADRPTPTVADRGGVVLLAVSGGLAVVAWLALAPEPRFGYAAAWAWAMAGLAAYVVGRRGSAAWLVLAVAVAAVGILHRAAVERVQGRPPMHVVLLPPGPDHGFHPLPTAPLEVYTTDSGLEVWTPVDGVLVWDAPLPAAPFPSPDLRARGGDWRNGFIRPSPEPVSPRDAAEGGPGTD